MMGNDNLQFLARCVCVCVYSHSSDVCTYVSLFFLICMQYDVNMKTLKLGFMGWHDCGLSSMYRSQCRLFVRSILRAGFLRGPKWCVCDFQNDLAERGGGGGNGAIYDKCSIKITKLWVADRVSRECLYCWWRECKNNEILLCRFKEANRAPGSWPLKAPVVAPGYVQNDIRTDHVVEIRWRIQGELRGRGFQKMSCVLCVCVCVFRCFKWYFMSSRSWFHAHRSCPTRTLNTWYYTYRFSFTFWNTHTLVSIL